jgi:hypothetical protein
MLKNQFTPLWLAAGLALIAGGIAGGFAEGNEKSPKTPSEPRNGIKDSATIFTGPIAVVRREVYFPSPQPGVSPVVAVHYLGKGLRRREIHARQSKSDLGEKVKVRSSDDNGRSWTPMAPLDTGADSLRQGTNCMEELSFAINYDPAR